MSIIYKVYLFVALCVTLSNTQNPGADECYGNGLKVDDVCVCFEGYAGNVCQHCVNRFVLNNTEGNVTDGPNTPHFTGCLAIINPPHIPNASLHLEFVQFQSLCCNDYLNIYDGVSVYDPLLATYSGRIFPMYTPKLVANSGSAMLNFYNDGDLIQMGYEIRYWLNDEAEEGSAFDDKAVNCMSGFCLFEWSDLLDQGRASFAVAGSNTSLYVYGGKMLGLPEYHQTLMRLDVESMEWNEVMFASNASSPAMRSEHSMVFYNNSLIVFGGKLESGIITDEMWSYDTVIGSWESVMVDQSPTTVVPPLMGHTAHVVNFNGSDVMLVFFGYSEQLGISNLVFQYDLNLHTWTNVRTTGREPGGTYGHASTLDAETNRVYVHGGYTISNNQQTDVLSNLYVYDVDTQMWQEYPSSPTSRYLHSISLVDGSLIVFGGLSEIKTPRCGCVVNWPMTYNLECGEWKEVAYAPPPYASPRYGHSAVSLNSSTMMVMGGFDGSMLSNVVTFSADKIVDKCSYYNETDCTYETGCSWNEDNCTTACTANVSSSENSITTVYKDSCSSKTSCKECIVNSSCCYAGDKCFNLTSVECVSDISITTVDECQDEEYYFCKQYQSCHECFQVGCLWNASCVPLNEETAGNLTEELVCKDKSCAGLTDCRNCTTSLGCVWCQTTNTCFKQNTMPITFPYGTCFDTATKNNKCIDDPCTTYETCDECFKDARCGWCDLGSHTGRGSCMSGSLNASLNITGYCPNNQWHFEKCVACQCNGHSTCLPSSPDTCTSCQDGTEGEYCEDCKPLWFGDPTNGGNCTECECNDHALKCTDKGYCSCYTTGVSGQNCQLCQPGYVGDAENDTCFYPTDIMTSYTFTLIPQWNYETTDINFEVCPPHQADVKIGITFSPYNGEEYTNLTQVIITTNSSGSGNETVIYHARNVSARFDYRLLQSQNNFGGRKVCVRIYTSMVDVPSVLTISVIQYFANVWMIVLIFVSCFLGLLIMAVIVWKINEVVLRHRRRARREIELERMAARPIAAVNFDTGEGDNSPIEPSKTVQNAGVVSEETCVCDEAAVYTVVLSLPTSEDSTFSGCSVALGTTLGTRLRFDFNSVTSTKADGKDKSRWKEAKLFFRTGRRQHHNLSFDNPVMDLNEQI